MGKTWRKRWTSDRKKSYVYSVDKRTPLEQHQDSINNMRRNTLYPYRDSVVEVSGVLTKTRYSKGHILLTDVTAYGEYFDHIWLPLSKGSIDSMRLADKGMRIYFTAKVIQYVGLYSSNPMNQHMGFDKAKLVRQYVSHRKLFKGANYGTI